MTRGIGHTASATCRSGFSSARRVLILPAGATDPDSRQVCCMVVALRKLRDVNLLELLPRPTALTLMFPTTRVMMDLPVRSFMSEFKLAVVFPNFARRQRRRIDDPIRQLARRWR